MVSNVDLRDHSPRPGFCLEHLAAPAALRYAALSSFAFTPVMTWCALIGKPP